MINRAELKQYAKEALRGKWGISIGVFIIYELLVCIPQFIPYIGYLAVILCSPALLLGITKYFLKIIRSNDVLVADLFSGFSLLLKSFCLSFMVGLFTFLWSLLLIVPGIIAAISAVLAECNVNILDISQTIMQDIFTMIMLTDISKVCIPFSELSDKLDVKGRELNLSVKIQHEDIFNSMHRI
jgi:ACT domain-containing protein